ncbi:bacteriocin transporter [Neisseria weixii]|uniref:Bacteriocin transporter n=1 Tax=Neisseria weixii TaxID=1853276 RepID=A0A3N4MYF6_9NEIS|nr:bacteriocin transporter [Neisseria weixii]RPD84229.1 bacteriocin transporter [Neisseria weixii]RPD84873.1 bacteriocin transporter [Neisseria weixii]
MKELNLYEMNQVSGGKFPIHGKGGGNPGQYIGGNIGISYKPEAGGFGFSYGRDFMHVNGFGTFSRHSSAMITFTKKW